MEGIPIVLKVGGDLHVWLLLIAGVETGSNINLLDSSPCWALEFISHQNLTPQSVSRPLEQR